MYIPDLGLYGQRFQQLYPFQLPLLDAIDYSKTWSADNSCLEDEAIEMEEVREIST